MTLPCLQENESKNPFPSAVTKEKKAKTSIVDNHP